MIRRPPRSTLSSSSAASDVYKRQLQSSIDGAVISDLASLRFVHNAENVVFLGPPGVGKSHLAIALGIEAVKAGMSVYFMNAGTLMERLKKAGREGKLDVKLKALAKYKLFDH